RAKQNKDALPVLTLAALGIRVLGDIGRRLLYPSSTCPSGLPLSTTTPTGILSLIFWPPAPVVIKYAGIVMRADRHSEYGIMVITALASRIALDSQRAPPGFRYSGQAAVLASAPRSYRQSPPGSSRPAANRPSTSSYSDHKAAPRTTIAFRWAGCCRHWRR
ncbi:MAG: KUP/HAK/KT family potassium transporter, partial [Gammaproteobacteria bacterium]|nr:KUP/HAK/KT family potassium transporter [Gammaproteobacteria bacterium]